MKLNIGMIFDSAWLRHSDLVALRIGFRYSQIPKNHLLTGILFDSLRKSSSQNFI